MSATRKTGPRVAGPITSTGPRVASAQPSTPPTNVQLGNDRLLVGAREVDIAQLAPDPTQPRKHMHPDRLPNWRVLSRNIAYSASCRTAGRVGPRRRHALRDRGWRRRYAAVRLAISGAGSDDERRRLARVPVLVTETRAAEQRVLQLIENLQREDLDPIEEARALKEVMRIEKLTTDSMAARVQRSQGYVDERLRLLRYEDVEEAVESGLLSKWAAAAIASIRMTEARLAWLERARLGETIRAREVYASKTDRRVSGRRRETALPNFGNTSSSEAARAIQAKYLQTGEEFWGTSEPRLAERQAIMTSCRCRRPRWLVKAARAPCWLPTFLHPWCSIPALRSLVSVPEVPRPLPDCRSWEWHCRPISRLSSRSRKWPGRRYCRPSRKAQVRENALMASACWP